MKRITLLLMLSFLSLTASAQLSGYFTQDFEAAAFPPTDWTVQNVAGPTYTWARSTVQAHSGTASAFTRYDSSAGGGLDWLITPQYSVVTGDSVVFWMRLAFAGYAPDSLAIKVSTTTNATASFGTTILLLQEGVNYPANSTTWYRYAVSLNAFAGQNVYIAFKHFNNDGDGLYVDDVAIGTKPPYNVATASINTPANVSTNTIIPSATIENVGDFPESFNVTAEINPGGYTSTVPVTALAANTSVNISTFTGWTPPAPGNYTIKVYTQLATDLDHLDDTLTKSISVLDTIPEYGWESAAPLPGGRWANATAFTKLCSMSTDTAYLYTISGNDASMATIANVHRLNLVTDTWSEVAPIPQARSQFSAEVLNGKIYVPGGYGGSFSPVTTLSIYDPLTNTWTTGAALPQATGDYALSTYGDSLLYVIGGYSGAADLNTVQIYNINSNTWTAGTPKIGNPTSGGRMGISGNTIIYAGGYSQTLAATQATAYKGVIDPVDPTIITWTALSDLPIGTTGRFGGGTALDGRIYFTAGDPDGQGTSTIASTVAYNTLTDSWELGPAKITGVGNVSDFTMVIDNDSVYMAVLGGYDGVNVTSVNEWLNIGLYTPEAAEAGTDLAICDAGTAPLSATGGTDYTWTPAAPLDDAASATPIASVTETDTFYVSIGQRFGCPVVDTQVVVVNFSTTASQDQTICFGETYSIGTSVYDEPGTYEDILFTVNGCDSVVTTVLTILPESNSSQTVTVCFGETFTVGSSTYSESGLFDDTLTSMLTGCDSIVITNLTVRPQNTVTNNISLCYGETYMIGSSEYDEAGTYEDEFTSVVTGCDSTVITNLTIDPQIDATVNLSGLTITAAQTGADYQWIDCSTELEIPGETGASFTATSNGNYAVVITIGDCSDTSDCMAVTTVGIGENTINTVQVYPNPNNGNFVVKGIAGGEFKLINELGQTVYVMTLSSDNSYTAAISGLNSGVYYLTGLSEGKMTVQKIVITE